MTAFALGAYPLSSGFRAQLDELAGESVEVVLLQELRRLGPPALARRLRGLNGRCFLPVEDASSIVLLPILELLAAATRATSIETVDAALTRTPVSRASAPASAARLGSASFTAQRALRAARRDVAHLLRTPRSQHAAGPEQRVLYVSSNLWFGLKAGGSIAHTAGVVNGLVSAGYDVELASVSPPAGLDPKVELLDLAYPRSFGLPTESNLYRWNESLPAQLASARMPAFVYQRHSVGSFAGVVASRRLGRPLVLEYNGSEVWVARNWGRPLRYETLALEAEQASLRHAGLVVTVSDTLGNELAARGVEPERIVVHPNGVDAERFDPARFGKDDRAGLRARYGIPPDAVLATFVGTFGHWHGTQVLARAIVQLADERRRKLERARLRFMFVGDGLSMPEVRDLLAGHEDLATIVGLVPQHEAPLYLAAADICVVPTIANADGSPFFGSPTKLFEYMAAGKAIVASDLDQIGQVLRGDGKPLGVLVAPGDPVQLADALLQLATRRRERARLGTAARRAVLERYTWHHHVQAILDGVARACS